jgi:hypothetical protein
VLFVTALALILTIDRTLNGIWRVRRPRPLAQRVLVYWAVVTLGPLLLAPAWRSRLTRCRPRAGWWAPCRAACSCCWTACSF